MPQDARDWERGINFVRQDTGVSTATQFAAEQGSFEFTLASTAVTSGATASVTAPIVSSSTNVVLELATVRMGTNYSENVEITHVPRDGGTAPIVQFSANPGMHPISFDPGVKVPETGDVEMTVTNNSSNSVTVSSEYNYREL
jgi:hypothetical protein